MMTLYLEPGAIHREGGFSFLALPEMARDLTRIPKFASRFRRVAHTCVLCMCADIEGRSIAHIVHCGGGDVCGTHVVDFGCGPASRDRLVDLLRLPLRENPTSQSRFNRS